MRDMGAVKDASRVKAAAWVDAARAAAIIRDAVARIDAEY
jgi:hypothetical protein